MNLLKAILGLNPNECNMFSLDYYLILVYGTELLEQKVGNGLIYNGRYYTMKELKEFKEYVTSSNYYDALLYLERTLKYLNYNVKPVFIYALEERIENNLKKLNIETSKVKTK